MLQLAARLIGGAFTPLIEQATDAGARLLWKLALFVVSGLASLVVLIALTVAFDLWIASVKGPIVGALAVAGLYASIAATALLLAVRSGVSTKKGSGARDSDKKASTARSGPNTAIDEFAAPLLGILERLGLRKEQLAVLAGMSVAKQMGPIPMVGLAIVAGFLIGRMWRGLFSADLLAGIFTSDLLANVLGAKEPSHEKEAHSDAEPDDKESRDAA